MRGLILGAIVAILALTPSTAAAGTTGGVTGTFLDALTSAPIANATVIATSPTSIARTTTNARGFFAFVSLTPDIYQIDISAAGYNPVELVGAPVFADQVFGIQLTGSKVLGYIDGGGHLRCSFCSRGLGKIPDVYAYSNILGQLFPPPNVNRLLILSTPGLQGGSGSPVAF